MSDLLEMAVGLFVPLFVIMATFVGSVLLLTAYEPWGMLVFLVWPFIGVAIVMFVLWWGER